MYFRLNDNISLRSWWLLPYAYYVKGYRNARLLKKDEFEFLRLCDSLNDLSPERAAPLVECGFIFPCACGEAPFKEGQYLNCENRYFPALCWMLTGKCNYNCLHCFNAVDNAPLQSEFGFDAAQRLMDDARTAGINAFTITGGEPMLHPRFYEIVEGIARRGMYVEELNTNGFFINEDALKRLRDAGCRPLVKISFDGVGFHDKMRGWQGAEKRTLDAIRLCIKNGLKVKVQTNVHRGNAGSIKQTLELMEGLGVSETRLIRTSESPRWLKNGAGLTLDITEYYDLMLDALKEYMQKPRTMAVDAWQFVRIEPKNKALSIHGIRCPGDSYKPDIPVCAGNRGMVSVAADGQVYPCLQLSGEYQALGISLGSVHAAGLIPLLQSGDYLNEVLTPVSAVRKENAECGFCEFFKWCCGGCRALAMGFSGDKLGADLSKCVFFKQKYYDKILSALPGLANLTPMHADT